MSVLTNSPNPQNPSEKEHVLQQIQFHSLFLDDALKAILQTLIFIRAPSQMKAQDHVCTLLSPLMYSSCNVPSVDQTIQQTIDMIQSSLKDHQRRYNPIIHANTNNITSPPSSYGYKPSPPPNTVSGIVPYRCDLLVSFYEKKETTQLLGLMSKTENIYFEHWRIPISIIDYPLTSSPSSAASPDFQQQYSLAYNCASNSIMGLIEAANTHTDHVPLTTYEFEMTFVPPDGKKKKEK